MRLRARVRLIVETLIIFFLLLPGFTVLLRYVRAGDGAGVIGWAVSVIGYWLVFPGWSLALWVFGYSGTPTSSSTIFIVVTNSLLYSGLAALVLFILDSARGGRDTTTTR